MQDFVRILKEYCDENDLIYQLGRKANLNLLKSNIDNELIYLLHEPSPRKIEMNSNSTRVANYIFSGMFFLVKQSTLDMPYFTEMDNDETNSKYALNIEPLLSVYEQIANAFGCYGFDVLQWECIDVVNVFDTNKDGLLVTYSVKIDALAAT
jgi:hypothetical protein